MESTDARPSLRTAPGAPREFEEFYASAWARGVRLAALLTQDASVAEEVAQEAFVVVLERWADLREPAGYLHRCITNSASMYHRRAGTQRRKLPMLHSVDAASLEFDELADAVEALPFRQRAVLVLRYHAGLSEREIGDVLRCRPGTVKSLASRALSTLHKELS